MAKKPQAPKEEEDKYSPLGERLYQILCTEIAPPHWTSTQMYVGQVRAYTLTIGGLDLIVVNNAVRVRVRGQDNEQDIRATASLTEADHARLVELVTKGIDTLSKLNAVRAIDIALTGVIIGPARDPARAKLTEDAVTMARLILKAAESDSVGESEVRQFIDKVLEDLNG